MPQPDAAMTERQCSSDATLRTGAICGIHTIPERLTATGNRMRREAMERQRATAAETSGAYHSNAAAKCGGKETQVCRPQCC